VFGVRALGDRLQAREWSCLDVGHETGLGQFLLQLSVLLLLLEVGDPLLLRVGPVPR
jgi:hypothetical protein